jgi:hypothetical protein
MLKNSEGYKSKTEIKCLSFLNLFSSIYHGPPCIALNNVFMKFFLEFKYKRLKLRQWQNAV